MDRFTGMYVQQVKLTEKKERIEELKEQIKVLEESNAGLNDELALALTRIEELEARG